MPNVLRFALSTVRNEDSFEQHEERSDHCVVSGQVSKRHRADERTISGMKHSQISETVSCFLTNLFSIVNSASFLNSNAITTAYQGSLVTKLILSMTRMINGRRISNWTRPVAGS